MTTLDIFQKKITKISIIKNEILNAPNRKYSEHKNYNICT